MEQYKTCTKCKVAQPESWFSKDGKSKDGKRADCKSCVSEYNKKYRQDNHSFELARMKAWRDSHPSYSKAYRQANYVKELGRAKAYRQDNADKVAARNKNYRNSNPAIIRAIKSSRRARLRNATNYLVTAKDIQLMLDKQCAYCNAPSEELDHIIPLSRGGNHSIGNLVGSCCYCNRSKHNKTITEWRIWKLRLGL